MRTVCALLLALLAVPANARTCAPDRIDSHVQIAHVYDGDTIRLRNGEKVRLIGFDTPELAHDQQPAEPYAVAARNRLQSLVSANGQALALRYDVERRDRHGRLLAHAFLADGRSVAAYLLGEGLATLLPVPPNVWNQACYAAAEHDARRQRTALWSLAQYQVTPSIRLTPSVRGFRVVSGRVERVGESKRNLWLNLPGNVALRIARRDLPYFDGVALTQLQGRAVTARGRLYWRNGQLRMQLRHPSMLEIAP